MNRPRVLSALFMAGFAMAVMVGVGSQTAEADTEVALVVTDGQALRQSEQGLDLITSFIGLVATLQEDQLFMFMDSDNPSDVLGPFSARDINFDAVRQEIEARLRSGSPQIGGDLTGALAEAHALLSGERAAAGSPVYLVTGSTSETNFDLLSNRAVPLVNRFAESGWRINGLSLPNSSAQALNFLDSISNSTGGQAFELSVSGGLRRLADQILAERSRGSLAAVGQRDLRASEIMSSVVTVAPGTRETTLVFFKESAGGSLRLSNPSGFELSATDRAASSVMETPNVVIWTLIEPAAGNWKIEARGMEGLVSAWEHSSNKYNLVMSTAGPVPLNEPTNLVAYVADNNGLVHLDGVRLFAKITTPEGTTLVHEMIDDGIGGDFTAGDGYFTMILPQLSLTGDYQVELELSWTGFNHQISSHAGFEAQAFPTIEVRPAQIQGLVPGERVQVATVYVHVDGEPYPVSTEQLTASIASPAGQEGLLELEPHRLFGQGPAWEYDVFVTPEGEGFYTQVFLLTLEYAGRMYSQLSDSIVLTSAAPPAESVVEEVVEVVTAPVSVPAVSSLLPPPSSVAPAGGSGFPWLALALPAIVLIAAAAAAVYLFTRTLPHGYLYNDKGEFLVDFANIKQNPIMKLIFRGFVRGSDLNVPGLEDLIFQFTRGGIKLRNLRRQQSVRVDNEPLVGQAIIDDQTWIGTRGKLFNFVLSPTTSPEGAGAD